MAKSKPLLEGFFRENNIIYYPSGADFILFKPENAEKMFECLKENGLLTRPRKGYGFDNTIRVTMGTLEQTKKFIATYKICQLNTRS